MLKLTSIRPLTDQKMPLYVSPVHIIGFRRHDGATSIWTTTSAFEVEETPEEILEMPEMLWYLNPAMVVKP